MLKYLFESYLFYNQESWNKIFRRKTNFTELVLVHGVVASFDVAVRLLNLKGIKLFQKLFSNKNV